MKSEFILSLLSQFEMFSLIGLNAMLTTMTTTMTMIFYYIIEKFMSLGFFSFIVNAILLILIEKKIFGTKIYNLVKDISKSRKIVIFICIHYFVFIYILIFAVKYNLTTIYLDSVNVNVVVNGVNASVTGDILAILKETFGDTAVFLGSARLAYLIIAKNGALSTLNRISIVLGGGAGGLTSYKVIDRGFSSLGEEKNEIILNGRLQLSNVTVNTSGTYDIPEHPVSGLLFGMNKSINLNNIDKEFSIIKNQGFTVLQGSENESSRVISALDNQNQNWKSEFHNAAVPSGNNQASWTINSPYESETNIVGLLIANLTDHFYLAVISIYLLLMLS
jgi:hypothetical protein